MPPPAVAFFCVIDIGRLVTSSHHHYIRTLTLTRLVSLHVPGRSLVPIGQYAFLHARCRDYALCFVHLRTTLGSWLALSSVISAVAAFRLDCCEIR